MSAHTDERAARLALEKLGGIGADAQRARLAPMPGGTHARSWLVTYEDGRRNVLRTAMPGSPTLLDVVTEARAMMAAASAGLAPAVVAIDADHGTLLTEYLGGTPWQVADAHRPRNLLRLAGVLRALHTLPVDLPAFAAERVARGYVARLRASQTRLDARAASWAAELAALARDYDERYAPTAFCHHDLVAANIIDDGELALVDFEYAVRGTPLLDLASFAAMNGLAIDERHALLAAYLTRAPEAAELAELAALMRLVRLMAWFWALLGAAQTAGASAYAPYVASLAADLERE